MKFFFILPKARSVCAKPVRIKAEGDGNPCTVKPKLSVELLVEKADFREMYFGFVFE